MTKKEMKELEEMRNEKRIKLTRFVESYNNYQEDVRAVARVARINGETEKTNCYGELKEEYRKELAARYENLEILKDLDSAKATAIRIMVTSKRAEHCEDAFYSQTGYNANYNAVINDESIWSFEEFKTIIEILKDYGFETVDYISSSTQAMSVINYMLKVGAEVIRPSYITDKQGIKFDITKVDVEAMKAIQE